MLIAAAFLINSAGNFALGVLLSAILGPAEFGRYATVALAGLTLSGAMFDWLRLSTLRFAGDIRHQAGFAASLEAANLAITLALMVAAGLAYALRLDFGLGPLLVFLTPLYTVAISRIDYSAAQFRARDQSRPFALIFGLRQLFCFAAAAGVAWLKRDAAAAVAALAVANLAAAIALGPALRLPGATLAAASLKDIQRFFFYAKPLVASFVLYALISLINRQVALAKSGAAETGEFALAFDLSQRLFQALYALPELFLFQYALKRDREEGRAAAEAQIGLNALLALAAFLPIAAGYFALGPTFEQIIVPRAFRGEFARLSLALAPGLICYGAIVIAIYPVFQLAQRTWPVIAAALLALATDAAVLSFHQRRRERRRIGARLFGEPCRRRDRGGGDGVPPQGCAAAVVRSRRARRGAGGDGGGGAAVQCARLALARRARRRQPRRRALSRHPVGLRFRRRARLHRREIARPARPRLTFRRNACLRPRS